MCPTSLTQDNQGFLSIETKIAYIKQGYQEKLILSSTEIPMLWNPGFKLRSIALKPF
jgi:hypothetical protein